MGVRVRVDRHGCQSSGRCVMAAPEVFRFDADRLAERVPGAPELPLERAQEIARACPALAIELFGDDGEPIDL